ACARQFIEFVETMQTLYEVWIEVRLIFAHLRAKADGLLVRRRIKTGRIERSHHDDQTLVGRKLHAVVGEIKTARTLRRRRCRARRRRLHLWRCGLRARERLCARKREDD